MILQVRSQECEKGQLVSPWLSVRSYGTTRFPMLFIVRLTQQYDVKLSYVQLIKLHVSTSWGHLQAYKI